MTHIFDDPRAFADDALAGWRPPIAATSCEWRAASSVPRPAAQLERAYQWVRVRLRGNWAQGRRPQLHVDQSGPDQDHLLQH